MMTNYEHGGHVWSTIIAIMSAYGSDFFSLKQYLLHDPYDCTHRTRDNYCKLKYRATRVNSNQLKHYYYYILGRYSESPILHFNDFSDVNFRIHKFIGKMNIVLSLDFPQSD